MAHHKGFVERPAVGTSQAKRDVRDFVASANRIDLFLVEGMKLVFFQQRFR